MSTGGRQYLTRSNAGNSVIFLISHTQRDVTLASLQSFCILENHKIKDLYKALYKISMISMICNRIKSYYAKSTMGDKKG